MASTGTRVKKSVTTVTTTGAITAGGQVVISGAGAGQIVFPATENASANANTLDDYQEFSWVPVLTFATPGDLAVTYATQAGLGVKIGSMVLLYGQITTSTFTHTTAVGALTITGNPLTNGATSVIAACQWQGITKAAYTDVAAALPAGSATITFLASGSGVGTAGVLVADVPTGGTVQVFFTFMFRI